MKNAVSLLIACMNVCLCWALPLTSSITDANKVDLSVLRRKTRSAGGQIGCTDMVNTSGELKYTADGSTNEICGLYLIGQPDQVVEVEFLEFNVECATGGVLAMFDGWELQGEIFPSPEDHILPMSQRYTMFCASERVPTKLFISSQNVALIQFRVPKSGEGFKIAVTFKSDPQPCNSVAMFDNGILTMKNYGQRRNCTTSIIFPEQIHMLSVDVGVTSESSILEAEIGLTDKQCMNYGGGDYVQVLNGNGLDVSLMKSEGMLCGMDSNSAHNAKFTLGCQHSVVRMVSSGQFHNTVTFQYAPPSDDADAKC